MILFGGSMLRFFLSFLDLLLLFVIVIIVVMFVVKFFIFLSIVESFVLLLIVIIFGFFFKNFFEYIVLNMVFWFILYGRFLFKSFIKFFIKFINEIKKILIFKINSFMCKEVWSIIEILRILMFFVKEVEIKIIFINNKIIYFFI